MADRIASSTQPPIAFIGGGNMAGAIIGGLMRQGLAPAQIEVVEPFAAARDKLQQQFGVAAHESAGPALERASLVVWAVKPQTFREAAAAVRAHTAPALHLSVAAGIRSDSIAQWLGTQRIVRAMPNTPALVGKGMTALYARPGVGAADQTRVEQVIATTGEWLWVGDEAQLDAVTALSGSGPAYVFFFLEAMTEAGVQMGLSRDQAYRLASGHLRGRRRAGARFRRSARGAAPARDLQGRHHRGGDSLDGERPDPGAVRQGPAGRVPARPRTGRRVRPLNATEGVTGHHAGKDREPQPVIEAKGLEAAFALAVADQEVVPDGLRRPQRPSKHDRQRRNPAGQRRRVQIAR